MLKQHTVTRQETPNKSSHYDLITGLTLNARNFGASTVEPSGAYSQQDILDLTFKGHGGEQ